MILDFHAHIYPEKIAQKASSAIGTFYGEQMSQIGTIDNLIQSGKNANVNAFVIHSVATTKKQVSSINNFIAETARAHKCCIGFGTMHQDYAQNLLEAEDELKTMLQNDLRGIKLHPDFQKFLVDDAQLDDLYALFASYNLPVLFHVGDARYDYSHPRRIANLLQKHPKLTVIAAHFGGYTQWQEAREFLCGKNVYFDTSSTLWKLDVKDAYKMIQMHGTEKFLFGSDFPMWSHQEELARFMQLPLNDQERDAIFFENASRLLNVKQEQFCL